MGGYIGLALSAVQGISQVSAGYAAQDEKDYNATLLEGKAGLIDIQKNIENEQYNRAKGQAAGESVASTAGAGLMLTGSKLAIMLDTQKQLSLDQAIGQFNFDQEKRFTLLEAETLRRGGDIDVSAGYSNAFSTALKGASNFAMYKTGGTLTQEGTVKDTTFDSITWRDH